MSSNGLEKRKNLRECINYVAQGVQCACEYWDIADGVWQLGYDVYRMTSSGGCNVVMGSKGMFYYKYYPLDGHCKSTIEQKTIAGAIQYAIRKLEGDYLCNIYLFDVDHYGTWKGQIMIGPTSKVWYTPVTKAAYKGCYSEGCDGLQSPFSCNSKEDGK